MNSKEATSLRKKKISELEYQNKLLNENYKSSEQEVKREFLNKLALAEAKANDAFGRINSKDDEISVLKREIDSLRDRVQEAYAEKERIAAELEVQIRDARTENALNRSSNNEELNQAQETIHRQEEIIRDLEDRLKGQEREATANDASNRRQIEMLRNQSLSSGNVSQELIKQKAEYEKIIEEKEDQRLRQKNEWAEVSYRNHFRSMET